MSQWSQKLDAYLSLKNMSKKQLAVEMGISINTLAKWWGGREPSPEHTTKILQLLQELPIKGGRHEDRSVVISLLRTTCPFCEHGVNEFQNCAYCGQHFVWADVPLEKS